MSFPAIILRSIAESVTSFVIGPTWSNDEAKATTPYLDTNPYVGFRPTTPQKAAGSLIEPPVSVPNAHGTIPAATAAAEPPEDPPGTLFKFQGFLVTWKYECSVEPPIANSSIFNFPKFISSSSFILSITVASYGAMKSSNIFEEHVVFTPFVQILSFIPIGIPDNVDLASPLSIFLSISFAFSKASSSNVVTKACTSFSFSAILSAYAFVIS